MPRRLAGNLAMNTAISVEQFISAIRRLPPDKPQVYSGKWYRTQKEHWLGWLRHYGEPGYYKRKYDRTDDAGFAYNHIVNFEMLLWIIHAAGVRPSLVRAARAAAARARTMSGKSAAIRRHVPWEKLAAALWSLV